MRIFAIIFTISAFLLLAGFLLWFLQKFNYGRKEPRRAILMVIVFGVLSVSIAYGLEKAMGPFFKHRLHLFGADSSYFGWLFLLALAVGLIEEGAKFWPLAIYAGGRRLIIQAVDGVVYFAVCGMTFGVIEDIKYTIDGGPTAITRILFGTFFHGATTGIVGYYFAKSKIGEGSRLKVWAAFGLAATVHALFDFGLFVITAANRYPALLLLLLLSLTLLIMLNIGLFLYYQKASDHDVAAGRATLPAGSEVQTQYAIINVPVPQTQANNQTLTKA